MDVISSRIDRALSFLTRPEDLRVSSWEVLIGVETYEEPIT